MSKIKEIINEKEKNFFRFKPERSFYDRVNIGHKRWGQLYRGETSPTVEELKAIADFFGVEVTELI